MKDKTFVLIVRQEKNRNGNTMWLETVGPDPDDDVAKFAINELLKFVKIRRID